MKSKKTAAKSETTWSEAWMLQVANQPTSMTQRKLDVVKARGGIAALKRSAKKHGVHLVQLTDDRGVDLVAASTKPFKVLT